MSCSNMLKRNGAMNPFEGFFFNDLSKRSSFCFPLSSGGVVPKFGLVQLFLTLLAVVTYRGSDRTVTGTAFQTGCLPVVR